MITIISTKRHNTQEIPNKKLTKTRYRTTAGPPIVSKFLPFREQQNSIGEKGENREFSV